MPAVEVGSSTLPYPGLRAFQREETDIFFGREEQTDELLRRLQRGRFLAVVGAIVKQRFWYFLGFMLLLLCFCRFDMLISYAIMLNGTQEMYDIYLNLQPFCQIFTFSISILIKNFISIYEKKITTVY